MLWDLKKCFGISKNVLGSQKMFWDLKKFILISKNVLGSQKMVDNVNIVDTIDIVGIVDTPPVNPLGLLPVEMYQLHPDIVRF